MLPVISTESFWIHAMNIGVAVLVAVPLLMVLVAGFAQAVRGK